MNSRKEALIQSQKKIKDSLENQITDIQENFNEIAKKTLLIGGSLAVMYGLITLINGPGKKKRLKKAVGQDNLNSRTEKVKKVRKREPLLTGALKEQAIVFLLGIATQKLAKFMNELDKEDSTNDSK